MVRTRNSMIYKGIEVNSYKKEKPTLSQYGLEDTDIDALLKAHDSYVQQREKGKNKLDAWKAIRGFLFLLFLPAPFLFVYWFIDVFFNGNTEPGLTSGIIVMAVGTILLILAIIQETKSDKASNGVYSRIHFPQKEEWEKYSKFKADCIAYENWEKRCNELFWEKLSGLQFEEEVTKLYNNLGYKAVKTRASNDGGVDIVLYQGKEKIAIQCKAYNKKISPSVARELYGVLCTGDYSSGIIATVNGASEETRSFCEKCKDKPIKIITVYDLINMQSQVI